MNIVKGFQIDLPPIFIPWKITASQLIELFGSYPNKKITETYYTSECSSLNGLKCFIGFHFDYKDGKLMELEFFRKSYDDQTQSFYEFQQFFEEAFGKPTNSKPGTEGFNNYEWIIDDVRIIHLIYDRFGPEEHMHIMKAN
jgi:hypothetical protein